MNNVLIRRLAFLATGFFTYGAVAAQGGGATCETQARQILDRLEAEVVGNLDSQQRGAANDIVLDVCHAREAQVEAEVEEAVQQAREEEQEKAGGWFTNSGNKEGNKRLSRKQH